MPELSVIVVNWNGADVLPDCLRSTIDETRDTSVEIIVVDNGSSDGSDAAAEAVGDPVRVIRNEENLGFTRANNIGIRQSRGRYIALVNSDVIVLPDCFRILMEYMDAHPEVGLVSPLILNQDGSVQRSCYPHRTYRGEFLSALGLNGFIERLVRAEGGNAVGRPDADGAASAQVMIGCFWLVRRDALDEVGLLDEGLFFYGDDFDWCGRFAKSGWQVKQQQRARAVHLGGGSSRHAPIRFFIELQKARLYYWRKHHGAVGYVYCRAMLILHHGLRVLARTAVYPVQPGVRPKNAYKLRRSLASLRWLLGLPTPIEAEPNAKQV